LVGVLPAGVRQKLYVVYAVLGFLLGALQVGWSSAGAGQPPWLTVVLAVYAFVGTGLGATAASNTQTGAAPAAPPPAVAPAAGEP
jgi:hypothetical protein